jgi:serine/threonine protein kinase/Flp pilus assembly protein TadD
MSPATTGFGDTLTMFTPPPTSNFEPEVTMLTPAAGSGIFDDSPTIIPRSSASERPIPAVPGASPESGPLEIGHRFGRYTIVRLLGIGGMGAVYQAWDEVLEVVVALKVIRPDVLRDPRAEREIESRFKRELLLARQVTHKNVVRIHDLGEIDGIKYITMSFVNGIDLATLVRAERRLAVPKALRIIRSVAAGLVAAHAAGVVHRDLKPANIMIDASGEALIMDFGIARSTGGSSAVPEPASLDLLAMPRAATLRPGATMAGTIVGTVEYMAPEQARGQPADQRADVYATGLMLYDLLSGKHRAEHAESAIKELRARMERPLPTLKSLAPQIPDALSAVVARAIEPDLEKRYQSTTELAEDLGKLDENGVPLTVKRVVGLPLVAAVVSLLLALSAGTWWYQRRLIPPKQHEPVTVLIADLRNNTGDSAFDHTLEPMLRRALEDAGFISAYDRSRVRAAFGVPTPEKLDDAAAWELALKQGVGVVLSGSIDRRGSGYEVSVNAAQTVTRKVVASARSRASKKDQVIEAATKLVTTVRKSLGDETSDSAQLLATKSLSTTSMEVASLYAAAVEAQANNKFEEARTHYLKTTELDPNFGLGYQGAALMSRNLGRLQDASKYASEALNHLERMTDRERFAVRASYYLTTGDSQQCAKEYGELIARYAADAVAHANRAQCLSKLRDMRGAVDEMRQAVQVLPKRVPFRANLAMYAAYSGDFQAAEREVGALQEPTDMATLALAFAQLGRGVLPDATVTYKKLSAISTRGASWATSGAGDLALYEGRFSEAARILAQGAETDLASKSPDRAARKLTSLAYAHMMRGQKAPAIAAAEKALQNSNAVPIRFLAARIFVEANEVAKAQTLAAGLSSELPAEPHAFGKIIEGEIALKQGDARQAVKILTDATDVIDTWLAHFDLGRAYLELKAFPQADSEFDRCIRRLGEALSFLADEEPTFGYFPMVYYYQGLAREGEKNGAASESYREYLKIRGGNSSEDPLLPEIRRRAGRG